VRAALAIAVVLLAVALVATTGLTQRSLLGTPIEDVFYGFFFDRYPLFAFAILYGVARLASIALEPGRGPVRLLTAPLAVALLLAVCLVPTFGGFVVRAGFFSGGMSFLRGQTVEAGYVLGAAMAALTFGLALGLGGALIRLRLALSKRAILRALLAFAALWWAALLIAAPRALGLDGAGGWPARPMGAEAALGSAALLASALLPHALLSRLPLR